MSCDHLAIGDSHPVWKLPPRSRPEVRKGIVKSRIITGTYILQIDRHKFKTVGSIATIIVSDGFLPQQGMHRSSSTQRSLQFFEEATTCTL
jgi:hypothetical protein